MKQVAIDTIISTLFGKGYVRCGYDGLRKEDVDYVQENIDELIKDYNKVNVSSDKLYTPVTITLSRIKHGINTQPPNIKVSYNPLTEDYEYNHQKPRLQMFDILVNTQIISIESIENMFGINEESTI